jgi:hypothetical protein
MILFAALTTLAGIAICTLIDIFYDRFANWLRSLPEALKPVTEGVLIGCKAYVEIVKSQFGIAAHLSKNYSKLGDKWFVTTAKHEVSISEIPDEIKSRTFVDNLLEVTNELELFIKR